MAEEEKEYEVIFKYPVRVTATSRKEAEELASEQVYESLGAYPEDLGMEVIKVRKVKPEEEAY
jgi:hypothetical protein